MLLQRGKSFLLYSLGLCTWAQQIKQTKGILTRMKKSTGFNKIFMPRSSQRNVIQESIRIRGLYITLTKGDKVRKRG